MVQMASKFGNSGFNQAQLNGEARGNAWGRTAVKTAAVAGLQAPAQFKSWTLPGKKSQLGGEEGPNGKNVFDCTALCGLIYQSSKKLLLLD